MLIGICGGTGSGKTTLAEKILEATGDRAVLIQHDHYYKDLTYLPFEERRKVNFDHPDSLDTDLMIEHLARLKAGRAIERPVYDFAKHNRRPETVRIEPKTAIVLEGILIFENRRLRDLMDIKIFVDTDADIRLIRRLQRDIAERGRTVDDAVRQWLETVRPMHLEFVEANKRYADLIVPEGFNPVSVDLVVEKIKAMLP